MNSKMFALSALFAAGVSISNGLAAAEPAPYKVVEGHKVDAATLGGWRAWRALACERCHGAQQEGLVGPSLLQSLRQLSQEQFAQAVLNGRPEKGMPTFSSSKMLTDNIDGLYAYLKGRSDGAIQDGRLEPLAGEELQVKK
jgi:mono/diheme cytochrome c family protein